MARVPVVKVTLDVFPCVDSEGVRTGSYGARLLMGPNIVSIPEEFQPVLVAGSLLGETGSGTVEGAMFLKYGGDGDCPAHLAEWNGRAVHAVRWSGAGASSSGMTVPMDFMIALADTLMPVKLYSKRWAEVFGPVPDPADALHPYADGDNDGIPNWLDPKPTDGPGWETPEPNDPQDPETPPGDGGPGGGGDGEDPNGSVIAP